VHKFLRAVGFTGFKSKEILQPLINVTIDNSKERVFTTYEDDILLAEYSTYFGPAMGVTVCGEMDKEDKFLLHECFPFFRADTISTTERVTVERHAASISYAGICEDERVGITIIFYLANKMPYIVRKNTKRLPESGTKLSLTGLSLEGTIMMPLFKDPDEVMKAKETKKNREKLMKAAKKGDESAMESLTLSDMDMYSQISRKIRDYDLFTVVDTYFMPFGVECDMYSILGEILSFRLVKNIVTNEEIYQMLLLCNEMQIAICINKEDLLGEPEVGRRFKGNIWLQGTIIYPD